MLDQMQIIPSSPSLLSEVLPHLATHPDFQMGLECGRESFEEMQAEIEDEQGEPKRWSEEDIMTFVAKELCPESHKRFARLNRYLGIETPSYFYNLGFVISWVDQAITTQAE